MRMVIIPQEAKQQLQQQAKANQLQSGEVMTPEKLRQIGGDVGSVDWPYAFNKNQTSNPDTGNVTQVRVKLGKGGNS